MDVITALGVLGVDPSATKTQIHNAYRAQAKKAHPDACGSDYAFRRLRQAFDVLYPSAPAQAQAQAQARAYVDLVEPVCGANLQSNSGPGWLSVDAERHPTIVLSDVPARAPRFGPAENTPTRPKVKVATGLDFDHFLDAQLKATR